ncbi:hypothetical protein HK407_02g04780 [Ordospora pajunii]|uniref:uncharacterized protein n=1 Tax=Ordospora pajunii TaxID=3039483 RepID=UPI0029526851|nr:uncharacterized protein HK407_02g04780 [Ordospora pajunii]KAH9412029.1 hypothetical protein HK407_02g04780 [Ordospora pajunii]
MQYTITSKALDEKVLAVHVRDNVYTGGTSGTLVNQDTGAVLCKCKKSVRAIASHGDYICCGSYDCTAVLLQNENVVDVIEGPDTEIKCVAFSEDGKHLAMATRGKSVWIIKLCGEIEIDKIIEDHLHDVKGCTFNNGMLFTYGYDNTIKVYDRFDYDDSWELMQSIDESNTVWCIAFYEEKMFSATEDGIISVYSLRNGWELETTKKMSVFPIYSMCEIGCGVAYVLNRQSIGIFDSSLNLMESMENIHSDCINSIAYDAKNNRIVSGGDDGILNMIEMH